MGGGVCIVLCLVLVFYYINKEVSKNVHNNDNEYYLKSAVKDDFKKYVVNNNMPKVMKKLKSGLDDLSIKHVDLAMDIIINFPPYS